MDRKAAKRKARERKRSLRKDMIRSNPSLKKDPSKLYVEISRLRDLEVKGKLDGPGRMKRKHLEEQFLAINKDRMKAGLPVMTLPEFDPNTPEREDINRESKTVPPSPPGIFKSQLYGNLDCSDVPMPSDADPGLDHGLPVLPPYLNFPL